ncbi:hypothetical protein [Piscinibacter sp.]|uniref:hypothetical protein n=1 Tax=Piscinibacter sp. TaxID=1903157 RepID=UPI0039E60E6F
MTIASRTLTIASVCVLTASAFACLIAPIEAATEFFPLLFWIHIAVIMLGILGSLRIRKLKSTWSEVWHAFLPIPRTLIILGIIAAAIAAYSTKNVQFDFGTLPDGTAVHSKNWSESKGRYWLSLNKQPEFEITKVQYQQLQRESHAFFALLWLLLSYLITLQWHYITRREAQRANAA